MFVVIIVIHYYTVCLITVPIDYNKQMNNAMHIFCKLPKFHQISDVLLDFHCLFVRQRNLTSNLLGIL